ncbi:ABC-type antimicrobial peptide transport system, ATPase component [Desulfosporosinus acidiphilus SJ4]|uniref:ABC-type antimicrobial peptide transport system, ATPase component n=1 Tax=Desulfosporosinus acidiphilus (strain DSM 22704 / JCM 16185 / SJ4) TaxID=646529 RepID=I4D1G3_DESAJ|nr:ABC transporter ATP-binding protein [Desulfosporosinus acidiphilus]AFM39637.1 ABC-type antimicrobial peptide transport system, ATPase component [Desulfosporosinus acidiphilus SJ4]
MIEIIAAKGVGKTFGNLDVVRHVDFKLQSGQFVALLGPSGSGKSTFIAMLSGLERPSSGEISVAGRSLTSLSEDDLSLMRREKIGIVFQFFNLIPTLNALENAAFPLFPVTLPDKEKRQKAAKALELVGMSHRATHRPGEMSGGERQRIAIARALVNDPVIILADEPTGNLDSTTGQEIVNLLASLSRARGTALLVATHDDKLAKAAEQVIYMKDGELVEQT